jgi:hypothetical protein
MSQGLLEGVIDGEEAKIDATECGAEPFAAAIAANLANPSLEVAPHWTDPLKARDDVLVKQGNVKDALAKHDDALNYAPTWKELKEVREAAAKQKNRSAAMRTTPESRAHG